MFIELTFIEGGANHPIQMPIRRIKSWEEHDESGSIVFLTTAKCDEEYGDSVECAESPAAIRSALLKAGLLVVVEEEAAKPEPKPKHVVRLLQGKNGWVWGNGCCIAHEANNAHAAMRVVAESRVRAIAPDAEIVWED